MKLALKIFVAALGLALFAWFVQRAGVGEIARAFANLGWLAPVVLLPFGLVYLLDTLGWRFAFGNEGVAGVGFGTLARIRWAGESINTVLPSAYIGGEAVKVQLLHKRGLPRVHSASSAVAGKTAQVVAQVMFIAAGAVAGVAILPPESPARAGMLTITALAAVIVALLIWLQQRGMFRTLTALLPVPALKKRADSLRRLDERIFEFYRKDRLHFLLSTGAYFAGWIADTLEILLVSHLLGMPIDFSQALAVEAFISVAKALGIFVPGALGVQESGIVFLCYLFGLPPALGVSYAIIRRGREVVYVAIGGMFLYAEGISFRRQIAPREEVPV
ncbi:MAG TPA: lysylphosphatidylglycerol synthase domain-containing protein [Chthoniobacterales bacterium]|nr:lysylphosphatidylglycerol synthase domain-containing protein [Chthoniobacterales bacterium]